MIDWTQPIFADCRPMHLDPTVAQPDSFKCLIFDGDLKQRRWYFNLDGTPFAKNPHGRASNFQVDIPEDEFHLAWLAEQDAKAEVLEGIPGYGSF